MEPIMDTSDDITSNNNINNNSSSNSTTMDQAASSSSMITLDIAPSTQHPSHRKMSDDISNNNNNNNNNGDTSSSSIEIDTSSMRMRARSKSTDSQIRAQTRKISKWPPTIILAIESAIELATIFPLVVGIIYVNIAYLLYGCYGIVNSPFTLAAMLGLYQQRSRPLRIYLLWKIVSIVLIVLISIAIGLLAKYDQVDYVESRLISVIILVGIGAFTIVWHIMTMMWIKPVLQDYLSKQSSKLKDDENIMMDDEAEYEMLSKMTTKPQYGVSAPEDPIRVAIRKFNKDPEKGMQYIHDNNILLGSTMFTNIVDLLHKVDDLNKVKLGEYLGIAHNKTLLQDFVNYYSFVAKEFDVALREFLAKFRLPREAQQIDRIMECFAIKYHQDNPGKFADSDTAYLLAFALILLNTDAHNPAIKYKMSKKVFVQNNLELRKGKKQDLTPEYLEKLYDGIHNDELKLDNENLFSNAQLKGWLHKMTSNKKHWQKRWFILKNNCLYYFDNDKDEENPKVIIPLEGLKVTKLSETTFQLEDSAVQMIKSVKLTPEGPVEGQHEKYALRADSPKEASKWMDSITNNVLGSPVLLLIKKKKKLLDRRTTTIHV
ncbi:hypothetical protein SAMD00019534_120100 [Acytostelium subglobosum LB1]|uniref:hypothetical protein n=1 Tax=Acytostelium subglobosum LB1 TaxID=1410327 RepID=UPI000644ADAD|nr:hypothetical protein SAMD00019534_120100 [Acytostelium subglobosum LB1]GAM28834.1 hypothetical protein SAMD00019534_120100 [Acytostelium subglobosum LB1]|eukprot:XP_012748206.1 hypothetical protein SAMD00019534_120100 [Acytostelium subglobosum LB1]